MRHGALSEEDGHRSKRTHALCNHLARGSKRSGCGDERRPLRSGSDRQGRVRHIRFKQPVEITLTCWIVNIVGVRAGVEHHPFWVCAIQPSTGTGTVSGCLRLLPLATLDPTRPGV